MEKQIEEIGKTTRKMSVHNSILMTKARSGTIDIKALRSSFAQLRNRNSMRSSELEIDVEEKESSEEPLPSYSPPTNSKRTSI
jgi:hypothetical protein